MGQLVALPMKAIGVTVYWATLVITVKMVSAAVEEVVLKTDNPDWYGVGSSQVHLLFYKETVTLPVSGWSQETYWKVN